MRRNKKLSGALELTNMIPLRFLDSHTTLPPSRTRARTKRIQYLCSEKRLHAKYEFHMRNLFISYSFSLQTINAFLLHKYIVCILSHDLTMVVELRRDVVSSIRKNISSPKDLDVSQSKNGTYFMYLHIIKNNFQFNRSLSAEYCFSGVYIRFRWLFWCKKECFLDVAQRKFIQSKKSFLHWFITLEAFYRHDLQLIPLTDELVRRKFYALVHTDQETLLPFSVCKSILSDEPVKSNLNKFVTSFLDETI